jgi:hypothetical protein
VAPVAEALPSGFALDQNYPNPFNPSTAIRFALPSPGRAVLKVYDILGKEVRTLADGEMAAGMHSVVFDATGLGSGMYLYRLQSGDYLETRRMLLLK